MDTIEWRNIEDETVPGLKFRVTVHPDTDTNPDEYDCYTDKQKQAWKDDEWQYVGVVVTPVINGIELDGCDDDLWGLEWGHFLVTEEDDTDRGHVWLGMDYFTKGTPEHPEYAYPVPDMIGECKAKLVKELGPIIDKLREAQMWLTAQAEDGK